jgi:outer membrane protein OmpA-like peptidoglycan-associated protein
MQRILTGVALTLAIVMVLTSLGCVQEDRYRAVLLRNREQEKALQEKEVQVTQLQERVQALQVQKTDMEQMLTEKDRVVVSAQRERDAYKQAYEEANGIVRRMTAQPVPVPGSGGLPESVKLEIDMVSQKHPGLFEFERETGRLRFSGDITFDSGSNAVKPDARQALTQVASILSSPAAGAISVTIVGHTDSDPVKKPQTIALLQGLKKATTNQGLSEARAEAVAEVLVAGGVAKARVTTQGLGSAQPIASNTTPEGKAKNRRVEIFLK